MQTKTEFNVQFWLHFLFKYEQTTLSQLSNKQNAWTREKCLSGY